MNDTTTGDRQPIGSSPAPTEPAVTREAVARASGPATGTEHRPDPGSVLRRWPGWVGYAAAAWAGSYAALALAWTLLDRGFPFGSNDPEREMSLLRAVPPDVGAPVTALLLAITAVGAVLMARERTAAPSRAVRRAVLTAGWASCAALLVVVPDMRLLARVGYAPMLIIGYPFGWPPDVDYSSIVTWPIANQGWSMVGGLLVGATVVAWQRRTRELCTSCGRGDNAAQWTTPAAAARWGRPVTYAAAVAPLVYGLDRLAWLAGLPVLISSDSLAELRDNGAVWVGAGLGTFAIVGTILTVGLVQRWGEVFPRWMLGLRGRRVPIALAVVPASVVAVLATSAGLPILVDIWHLDTADPDWMTVLPGVLWPFWGVALAAATLAYYLRRRGRCTTCGHS